MHRAGGPPRHRAPSQRSRAVAARARHASARGEGFGRFAAVTILSLIPGAGLLAAGRRRVGAALLALVALALVGATAFAVTGDATSQALRLAVRPSDLLIIAVAVGALAIAWWDWPLGLISENVRAIMAGSLDDLETVQR